MRVYCIASTCGLEHAIVREIMDSEVKVSLAKMAQTADSAAYKAREAIWAEEARKIRASILPEADEKSAEFQRSFDETQYHRRVWEEMGKPKTKAQFVERLRDAGRCEAAIIEAKKGPVDPNYPYT